MAGIRRMTKTCSICGVRKRLDDYTGAALKNGAIPRDAACNECTGEAEKEAEANPIFAERLIRDLTDSDLVVPRVGDQSRADAMEHILRAQKCEAEGENARATANAAIAIAMLLIRLTDRPASLVYSCEGGKGNGKSKVQQIQQEPV